MLRNGYTTAVALVADNFVTGCLCFVDDLHGAEDVDTGVKSALVKNNEAFSLGLSVKLQHLGGNVAGGGHIDTNLDADREHLHVHPGWNEGEDEVHLAHSCFHGGRIENVKVNGVHVVRVPGCDPASIVDQVTRNRDLGVAELAEVIY